VSKKKEAKEQGTEDGRAYSAQSDAHVSHDYSQITSKFPWVTQEEFVAHYSAALAEYLATYSTARGKTHIVDLSAPASAFAEAWWAIIGNMNYSK
jgi:hypothetical protein